MVYFLPQDLIDNSMAAWEVGGKTLANLDRSKPYIGPQTQPGQLGYRIYMYGPWQARFDVSLAKIVGLWGSVELTSYLSRVWFDDSAQGPIHLDAAAELMLLTRVHAALHPPKPVPAERDTQLQSGTAKRGSAWDDAWHR